jgi:tRNA pseudouridine38-40 synthase
MWAQNRVGSLEATTRSAYLARLMESPDLASFLLVTHYDGGAFSGWQRQRDARTVQGEMEAVLAALCGTPVTALGSGRTDAGVHARGQAVGVRVPKRWTAQSIRHAMNSKLPRDVWVAKSFAMQPEFHARFSAARRRYAYFVGTDQGAMSPFRRQMEWPLARALDLDLLNAEASSLPGIHAFRAFAIQGTAPPEDNHVCELTLARWRNRDGGVVFDIEANRFLHHMVRFLVGTMVAVATGRRPPGTVAELLAASDNRQTAAPAPPQGLFLEQVSYPATLYLSAT